VAELLERTVTAYGADADFTAMARMVESDAGLAPAPSPQNPTQIQ